MCLSRSGHTSSYPEPRRILGVIADHIIEPHAQTQAKRCYSFTAPVIDET